MKTKTKASAGNHGATLLQKTITSLRGDTVLPADPMDVDVRDGRLWVTLRDGRVIGTPLEWYPRLHQARPEQLRRIEVTHLDIYFPDLDETLGIKWMLLGQSDPDDLV